MNTNGNHTQSHAEMIVGDGPSIEALQAEVDFWRSRYEAERERLMKLWTLYREQVDIDDADGAARPIFFFSKHTPRTGTPSPLPSGSGVEVSRTGLPFVLRLDRPHPPAGPHPERRNDLQPQCAAFAVAGDQCRNSARGSSKYCASHVGYRPRGMASLVAAADTRPRGDAAVDTAPRFRGTANGSDGAAARSATIQCGALTDGGRQCRNQARAGRLYCTQHRGHHPASAARLVAAHDTAPRVTGARDTEPAIRA